MHQPDPGQMNVLQLAGIAGHVTLADVEAVCVVSLDEAGRILDQLCEHDLLARAPHPTQRRFCLTTEGGELVRENGGWAAAAPPSA